MMNKGCQDPTKHLSLRQRVVALQQQNPGSAVTCIPGPWDWASPRTGYTHRTFVKELITLPAWCVERPKAQADVAGTMPRLSHEGARIAKYQAQCLCLVSSVES